jgi:hypothetical protein
MLSFGITFGAIINIYTHYRSAPNRSLASPVLTIHLYSYQYHLLISAVMILSHLDHLSMRPIYTKQGMRDLVSVNDHQTCPPVCLALLRASQRCRYWYTHLRTMLY